jgi:hypothetical protein
LEINKTKTLFLLNFKLAGNLAQFTFSHPVFIKPKIHRISNLQPQQPATSNCKALKSLLKEEIAIYFFIMTV